MQLRQDREPIRLPERARSLSEYSWFSHDITATHVGVQNNSEKSPLGIWLYYYAKLQRHFVIVLYTNMVVSSYE